MVCHAALSFVDVFDACSGVALAPIVLVPVAFQSLMVRRYALLGLDDHRVFGFADLGSAGAVAGADLALARS